MAISFSGFDNPIIAARQGAQLSQDYYTNQRKAAAYNALREQYGDIAGDPDSAVKLGNYLSQQQKLPLELEGMSIKNKTAQQSYDFNEQNNPMVLDQNAQTLRSNQQTIDFNEQNNPIKLQSNQQTLEKQKLGNVAQSHEILDSNMERQRNAVLGVVASVRAKLDAGMDPEQAFDSSVSLIAQQEGVDPQQLGAIKQAYMANPKAALDAIENGISAAHPNAALMRAQAAQTSAEAAKIRATNVGQGKAAKTDPMSQLGALEVNNARIDGNISTIDSLLGDGKDNVGLLRQGTSGNSFVRGLQQAGAERGIPLTSDSYSVHKAIDEIKHAISITDLQNMKNLGVSLGRVTNVEFQAAADALTSLDPRESPARTAAKLQRVRNFLLKAKAAQVEQAQRIRAGLPTGGAGGAQTAAPAAAKGALSADDFLKKYNIGQ